MKAEEVIDALLVRHGVNDLDGQWACIAEPLQGITDLMAFGIWATAKAPGLVACGKNRRGWNGSVLPGVDTTQPIVSYEVKVSRSDFRRDLVGKKGRPRRVWDRTLGRSVPLPAEEGVGAWPEKAARALALSHYFMFATPAGLLTDEEIARRERPAEGKGLWVPPEAGLVEVTGSGCRVRVKAEPRTPERELTRREMASLIRLAANPKKARDLRWERDRLREEVRHLHRTLLHAEALLDDRDREEALAR